MPDGSLCYITQGPLATSIPQYLLDRLHGPHVSSPAATWIPVEQYVSLQCMQEIQLQQKCSHTFGRKFPDKHRGENQLQICENVQSNKFYFRQYDCAT